VLVHVGRGLRSVSVRDGQQLEHTLDIGHGHVGQAGNVVSELALTNFEPTNKRNRNKY
jgi:hypothetical protein